MFKSNNLLVKFTGYFLIGFFIFIVVLAFGMPDFDLNCGTNPNTVAVVNNEKVDRWDYNRYRENEIRQVKARLEKVLGNIKDEKIYNQLLEQNTRGMLDRYIMQVLINQKAHETGLEITDERFKRFIKTDNLFINPTTGKYDPQRLKYILNRNRMSFEEFEKIVRKDLLRSEFMTLISSGIVVSKDEIIAKFRSEKSVIKINYCFLSDSDIRRKYKSKLAVSDKEVEAELSKLKEKPQDLKVEKIKIKGIIESQKLADLKKSIAEKMTSLYKEKASFTSAARTLKGESGSSEPFSIGGNVKSTGKKSASLTALAASDIFRQNLMKMPLNSVSPPFQSGRGIYIFTPTVRSISKAIPSKDESERIKSLLFSGSANSTQRNLLMLLNKESKIIKNLKTN